MRTELPELWCVKRNKDNYNIINSWFIKNQKRNYSYSNSSGFVHSSCLKDLWINSTSKDKDHIEITFEEFKYLILKEKPLEPIYEIY